MPQCVFCGEELQKGTGKMFIYNSGKIIYFCSRKCEKNLFKLKRVPATTRWTKEYGKEVVKEVEQEQKQ